MLRQQVLAVIITVRCSNHSMNMVPGWGARCIFLTRTHRILMIEFDKDYGAVNSVIKNRIVFCRADPGEIGIVDMLANFIHGHLRVRISQLADE